MSMFIKLKKKEVEQYLRQVNNILELAPGEELDVVTAKNAAQQAVQLVTALNQIIGAIQVKETMRDELVSKHPTIQEEMNKKIIDELNAGNVKVI
jgi:hypothetical protein